MKTFGGLVLGVAAVGMILLMLVGALAGGAGGGLGAAGAASQAANNQTGTNTPGRLTEQVPALYRELLARYGTACLEISPALLAAQIEAESNWNPAAVSPAGARGLTQFMPGTWAAYGTDGNGDNKVDPNDPADAIASQARYLCVLASQVRAIPGTQGTITQLMLAAYNAGPGAVSQYKGVPPFAETLNYVKKILALVAKYEAATPVTGGDGGWRDPAPPGTIVRGTPFRKPGAMWRWKGWHTGADYPGALGTPVLAAGPGTISQILTGGSYGNHVFIDHGQIDGKQITTLYAHMIGFKDGLTVGQKVNPGDQLGYLGATGNVTGPHIHMEVRVNFTNGANDNEFTDPWTWIDSHREAAPDALGQKIVDQAKTWTGVPYVWGGGSLTGPSPAGLGEPTAGFDCSGLLRAAVHQATEGRVTLPRVTTEQATAGVPVATTDRQPGDLIFFDLAGAGWDHAGIYIGNGQMIHAPSAGKNVEIVALNIYYGAKPQITRRVA